MAYKCHVLLVGLHTFDHFYFWEMAVGPDSTHQIQAVIAAQHVLSVRRATKKMTPSFFGGFDIFAFPSGAVLFVSPCFSLVFTP